MLSHLDALLGVRIFGLASRGPVFVFWLAVYDKTWEGVYSYEIRVTENHLMLTHNVPSPPWRLPGV